MTANKENLYWKTDKAWYHINDDGEFELTEAAPERAKKSFALFSAPNPAQASNDKRLKLQMKRNYE